MKLFELAGEAISLLKESGVEGIRSNELAEALGIPKRRVYDVIAILRALDCVDTHRKYDGTTITWIDRFRNYVPRDSYDDIRLQLETERESRKKLQDQVVELKEQIRITRMKIRRDVEAVESIEKTEFSTCQIKIRPLSGTGFKRVMDSGMEVIIETDEPGMIVDPTETESDENEELLKHIQKL